MIIISLTQQQKNVAPHVGAWIEMGMLGYPLYLKESHPMWVRGLKCGGSNFMLEADGVAPHVGAWIEIVRINSKNSASAVAPHVGAWIEIHLQTFYTLSYNVAPHVGAWIEIFDLIL